MNSKRSKKQPLPQLQWPILDGRFRYPLIEVGRSRIVPLRPLAVTIGCTFASLATALSELPKGLITMEVSFTRIDGRLARSPGVAEGALDYLLFAWRGQRGKPQVRQLRECARRLALEALLAMAPASDQAKVQNEILRFQLEVERQKVSDRDRQLDSLKSVRPGVALVNTRWAAPATKEKLLKVWALRQQGLTEQEICARASLTLAVVRPFLKGSYTTVAAREAYADLQSAPEEVNLGRHTPTEKMPSNDP